MTDKLTHVKSGRLLFALAIALITLSAIIFSSLLLNYQHQQQKELDRLVVSQQNLQEGNSSKALRNRLLAEWQTFQISHPDTQLAMIRSHLTEHNSRETQYLFGTLAPDQQPIKTELQDLSADYITNRHLNRPTTDIWTFLAEKWQTPDGEKALYIRAFNHEKHWYFVAFQDDHGLPEFVMRSFNNTFGILLVVFILTFIGFFVYFKRISKLMSTTQSRYHQIIDHNMDWVWETDIHGTIIYSSEHSLSLFGMETNQILGINLFNLIDADYHPETVKQLQSMIKQPEPFYNQEVALKHSAKKNVYGVFYGKPFFNKHDELIGFRGTCRNITAFKERQNRLQEQLDYDPVTQLPSRAFLISRLKELFDHLEPGDHYCIIMLDLNGLQEINNLHGHKYSTLALHLSAERIRKTVPQSALVSRLNGTEFAMLLRPAYHGKIEIYQDQIELIAKEIIEEINQPMIFDNHNFELRTNLGIAIIPQQGNQVSDILASANQALYESKRYGYNRIHFASKDPVNKGIEHQKTLSNLKQALTHNEFRLLYQMQVDTQKQDITSFEALLRWKDPKSKQVVPAKEFIEIAEENNQIFEIDNWVLNRLFADWNQLTEKLNPSPQQVETMPGLSMNISSDSLTSEDFVARVKERLKNSTLPPSKLRFEITESQLLRHANHSAIAINNLHELGVKFSIDRFGTGYSNLSYLQSLPIEFIKLDNSHTQDIATNRQHLSISKTIIQMAHSLGIEVVAEGIESDTQKQVLQNIGCVFMQGYLFSELIELKTLIHTLEKLQNDSSSLY